MTSALLNVVTGFGQRDDRVTHARAFPATSAHPAEWPAWAHEQVVSAWRATDIDTPWQHQITAANLIHAGTDTIISTGTASGKSLGFWLPVAQAAFETKDALPTKAATTLYLSPTKALGHDQLSKLVNLPLQGLRAGSYDGDTTDTQRQWTRAHANVIFTNPDMLHRSILPAHPRFSRWLKTLRYIIIDEAHRYRGLFGSHVALVIRRLLRVAALYGANPTIVGASATMSEPATTFSRFTGQPTHAVTTDHSPRSAGTFLLWEPPLHPGEPPLLPGEPPASATQPAASAPPPSVPGPTRRSTISETVDILTDTTCAGHSAIAFIASRAGAEAVADAVRTHLTQIAPELTPTVAAYRGGYLPEERRLLETGLRAGRLRAVASTNALELGIDISGVDVVVIAGWPGTLASLWQQAGRAGRAGQEWVAVLIARDDPLDTFVVHHPERVFDSIPEAVVINPDNPHVLSGHLLAAAHESPLTDADFGTWFGPAAANITAQLAEQKKLRHRPTGWFWTQTESAADLTDIRGSGDPQVRLVDEESGTLLGTVDGAAAPRQCHPGAVYLHQGQTFTITQLDLDDHVAFVTPATVDYFTQARSTTDIRMVTTVETVRLPSGASVSHGEVEVTNHVTGYAMRNRRTGVTIGEYPLDLPAQTLRTHAVWWTAPTDLVERAQVLPADLPGAVHAAEHASIGLLPLFAGCDRWDIGGVSTANHIDTGHATVFVYDGQPGGAGFTEHGFSIFTEWYHATHDAIRSCECATGCPSCIQSPKCGNGNEPLDKDAALRLLEHVLAH